MQESLQQQRTSAPDTRNPQTGGTINTGADSLDLQQNTDTTLLSNPATRTIEVVGPPPSAPPVVDDKKGLTAGWIVLIVVVTLATFALFYYLEGRKERKPKVVEEPKQIEISTEATTEKPKKTTNAKMTAKAQKHTPKAAKKGKKSKAKKRKKR